MYANRTYVYTYDTNGNILTKKEYSYTTGTLGTLLRTTAYTYGNDAWGDLLTNYNGTNISYDEIGNPLNWHNVTSMTWTQGRRLTGYTYTKDGKTYNVTLNYNAEGIRISKLTENVNDSTEKQFISYVVDGTKILKEYVLDISQGNGTSTTILYMYDDTGEAVGLKVGSLAYFYGKNAQGDVVAIFNSDSALVARYYYDAWGNVVSIKNASGNEITASTNVAIINPIRYRSYYYDKDTGFYYLNSRYYDPQVGRFINADVYVSTGQGIIGNNMFAYCGNNPVMFYDPDGQECICFYERVNPRHNCTANFKEEHDTVIVAVLDSNSIPDHPDYSPPKKWDGKKVNNPNGKGKGWPAKDGGVWIPSPNMHGGEGWTIQYPGGKHDHAYVGGGRRTHYQAECSFSKSLGKIVGGALITTFFLLDDFTIIGTIDDAALVGSTAMLISGINEIFRKEVCSVCGEVIYGH